MASIRSGSHYALNRGILPSSLILLFRGATFLIGVLDLVATGRVVAYISNPIILMKLDMRGEGITGTESLGVHWYALNTKAKYEGLVAQQFERIVIECLFFVVG